MTFKGPFQPKLFYDFGIVEPTPWQCSHTAFLGLQEALGFYTYEVKCLLQN